MKCLKHDNENGKTVLTEGSLVSSMLIVLGAPRLIISTSVSMQGRLPSAVLLRSVLCLILIVAPDSMIIPLLMEKLIRPSQLVFRLGQRLGSCVSVVHTTASFLQNIIELPTVWNDVLLLLLTWTSNFLVCF